MAAKFRILARRLSVWAGQRWARHAWSAAAGRVVLDQLAGGRPVVWCRCTDTRVDVGQWFHDSRVWLGLCDDTLLVCAAGRRPLRQRLELDALRGSVYNAVTGQLSLSPAPGALITHVDLPPVEGEDLAVRLRGGRPGSV